MNAYCLWVLFPFDIWREAGFDVYGHNVRNYLKRIVQVLENPCLGQRLRHPASAPDTEWRWDHFCKVDLPRRLRLIYLWDPDRCVFDIVAFGPHLGHGEVGDVYDDLADMFDLPADERHAQLDVEPCCTDLDPAGRTVGVEDGVKQIERMTRR